MALTARVLRATTCLYRPQQPQSLPKRSFISLVRPSTSHHLPRIPQSHTKRPKRKLQGPYQRCASTSAVAPNSKAYLESGVIAGGQDLVDVKKVLVIGSGGLSIGQAGEFDYSGESQHVAAQSSIMTFNATIHRQVNALLTAHGNTHHPVPSPR